MIIIQYYYDYYYYYTIIVMIAAGIIIVSTTLLYCWHINYYYRPHERLKIPLDLIVIRLYQFMLLAFN